MTPWLAAAVRCTLCVALAFAWCAARVDSWQQVDWPQDVDLQADDRDDILRLARVMGMPSPARVSLVQVVPGAGQFLVVSSGVSTKGPHRTWTEVRLCRVDWTCRSGQRVGRWTAVTSVEVSDDWRIDDGGWHVRVSLGDGVAYADAATIGRAIRRGTLVDRLPTFFGPRDMTAELKRIDLDRLSRVERDRSGFTVSTDQGHYGNTLHVTLGNGVVELHGIGEWIA